MNAISKTEETHSVALAADPMVSMIERLVLNPEADLDKLGRMLSLKREHDRDHARISLAAGGADHAGAVGGILRTPTKCLRRSAEGPYEYSDMLWRRRSMRQPRQGQAVAKSTAPRRQRPPDRYGPRPPARADRPAQGG